MKKAGFTLILPVLSLLMPGCHRQQDKTGEKEGCRVRVETVKHIPMTKNTYIGVVEASVSTPLSFQVTGTVEQVFVHEGETVYAGQLLASLDDRSYRDALSIAEAKEMQAEDAWKRLSELHRKGSLPEIKYVEIESGVSQARAAASLARKNLNDCKLMSPRVGVIGKRSVEPGENIIPYQTVFTLLNTDQLDVKISVPEQEIAGITSGEKADITVAALENMQFTGNVLRKGVIAQPISHTYDAMIRIQQKEPRLLPGMVCRVEFQTEKREASFTIPVQVVQTDGEGIRYILVPDETGTKVCRREVTTGELIGLDVVITEGLAQGDRYISEGYQQLDTTMNIQILK
jgi:RND family efflux transporter MFP subunit